MNILIYRCQSIRCIPPKYGKPDPTLEYCQGWHDFKGMGIAVIGTWRNYATLNPLGKTEVFTHEHLPAFQNLVDKADKVVGFNSLSFDDNLLRANGIDIKTDDDLLCQVRVASGQPPHYVYGLTRAGYSLERLAQTNLGREKTLTGSRAPALWQRCKKQAVIDSCLADIQLTKDLYFRHLKGKLYDPISGTPLNKRYTQSHFLQSGWEKFIALCCGARLNKQRNTAHFSPEGYDHFRLLVGDEDTQELDQIPF